MILYLATALFACEVYNFVAHLAVLTGIRLLPRKVFVKQRYYYIFEMLSCVASFLLHGKYWLIILLHILQHLDFFSRWDARGFNNRLMTWSTMDWDLIKWHQFDSVTMTLWVVYDVLTHAMNAYFLMEYLNLKL